MKLSEVTDLLESLAPPTLQESYDNAGLICGNPAWEVKSALATIDCTPEVVEEAIDKGCNLIIAHHPIVFSGLKSLTGKNYIERTIILAIKNDIAIYAIHTNLDNVWNGVNRKIGEKLGLKNLNILAPKADSLLKLHTFIPTDHLDSVKNALFDAGAGHIGEYDHCSYTSEGIGTYRASTHANPFTGEIGVDHKEAESRLEILLPSFAKGRVVRALLKNHPYEEVAYDLVAIQNQNPRVGSGMIGQLENPMHETEFLKHVSKRMNVEVIRHTQLRNRLIKTVAFCGGAGSFLLSKAISSAADVFITGDFKYHEFFDADDKIVVMDIGHFESEQFTSELIADFLREKNVTFAVLLSEVKTNPVHYFIS